MKHLFNLSLVGLMLFTLTSINAQAIIGAGGLVHTNADPDLITNMQIQDARYEAMLAYDTIARELYVYDGSQASGNRWANIPLDAVTDTDTRLNAPVPVVNPDGTTTVTFQIYDEVNDANTGGTVSYIIPRAPIQSIVAGTNSTPVDDGNGNITINVVVDLESTYDATGNGEFTLSNAGSSQEIDVVAGSGLELEEISTGRYRFNNEIYTTVTAANYSDAASQGVQINEWFIAAQQNTMGANPGSLIKKLF